MNSNWVDQNGGLILENIIYDIREDFFTVLSDECKEKERETEKKLNMKYEKFCTILNKASKLPEDKKNEIKKLFEECMAERIAQKDYLVEEYYKLGIRDGSQLLFQLITKK